MKKSWQEELQYLIDNYGSTEMVFNLWRRVTKINPRLDTAFMRRFRRLERHTRTGRYIRRKFYAMRDQQKKEDMLLRLLKSPRAPCPRLKVVIYSASKVMPLVSLKLNKTLPATTIVRDGLINQVEGTRTYPKTKVVFKRSDDDEIDIVSSALESSMFRRCSYVDNIMNRDYGDNLALAYASVGKVNDVAVAACSWSALRQSINQKTVVHTIKIKYLCSAKVCSSGGTAIFYAMEELARSLGAHSIRLLADHSAKPFYFKIGLRYNNSDAHNASILQIDNNKNTANSKQRIRYPKSTTLYMVKNV